MTIDTSFVKVRIFYMVFYEKSRATCRRRIGLYRLLGQQFLVEIYSEIMSVVHPARLCSDKGMTSVYNPIKRENIIL